jgi:UDP-2,3-diacylglucosamine hydrolase
LGLHPVEKSLKREKLLIQFLDHIKNDASELYLMGDIFDFWWEYKRVVPGGFTRFIGKLAELNDKGIKIHFFTGNHDIWVFDYLKKEVGLTVYKKPVKREIHGLKFFLAHGDGLGPGDCFYKILKAIFRNRVLQWLFAHLIHPDFAVWLGTTWSKNSRYAKGIIAEPFAGNMKEQQILFAKGLIRKEHFDFFICGHRHIPYDIQIAENTRVINLGDWIYSFTYGVLDNTDFELKHFTDKNNIIMKRL